MCQIKIFIKIHDCGALQFIPKSDLLHCISTDQAFAEYITQRIDIGDFDDEMATTIYDRIGRRYQLENPRCPHGYALVTLSDGRSPTCRYFLHDHHHFGLQSFSATFSFFCFQRCSISQKVSTKTNSDHSRRCPRLRRSPVEEALVRIPVH